MGRLRSHLAVAALCSDGARTSTQGVCRGVERCRTSVDIHQIAADDELAKGWCEGVLDQPLVRRETMRHAGSAQRGGAQRDVRMRDARFESGGEDDLDVCAAAALAATEMAAAAEIAAATAAQAPG